MGVFILSLILSSHNGGNTRSLLCFQAPQLKSLHQFMNTIDSSLTHNS